MISGKVLLLYFAHQFSLFPFQKACSYFTSNALPLKITFINANPMGKNISIIFKVQ
jgi:hypothetical protein